MMNADLISRSDLMRRLERKKCGVHDKTYTDGFNDAILRVRSMVNGAAACPTTDWKSVLADGLPPLPRCEHTLFGIDPLSVAGSPLLTLVITVLYRAGYAQLRNV